MLTLRYIEEITETSGKKVIIIRMKKRSDIKQKNQTRIHEFFSYEKMRWQRLNASVIKAIFEGDEVYNKEVENICSFKHR